MQPFKGGGQGPGGGSMEEGGMQGQGAGTGEADGSGRAGGWQRLMLSLEQHLVQAAVAIVQVRPWFSCTQPSPCVHDSDSVSP